MYRYLHTNAEIETSDIEIKVMKCWRDGMALVKTRLKSKLNLVRVYMSRFLQNNLSEDFIVRICHNLGSTFF